MKNYKAHWESVYNKKDSTEVSWFQDTPKLSLELIQKYSKPNDSFIDIGSGATRLVDCLLELGYSDMTVLDISSSAFEQAKKRLGMQSEKVNWTVDDITEVSLPKSYQIWHDRAVFHFLSSDDDQKSYLKRLNEFLVKDGIFIISTFAENGPLKCSGLEIVRYSKEEMVERVGNNFELIEFVKEDHHAPSGVVQKFNYWVFKKLD